MLKPLFCAAALSLTALLSSSACAPVDALNAVTPKSGYSVAERIFFRGDRGKMDIYTPDTVKPDSPVIIFFYGGGWNSGEKSEYKFVGQAFAAEGYVVAIPNYRIYPEVQYPYFVEDGAKAVRFISGLYPDRPIVLMGHSAGGYITNMLALEDSFLSNLRVDRCGVIAGAVPLAGPAGIVPLSEEPYISIFPQRMSGNDSPLNAENNVAPRFFLAHGKDDTTVYPQNSQTLATKILVEGGQAYSRIYEGHDHIDTVKNLSVYFDGGSLKSDIVSFIDSLPKEGPFCLGG